MTDASLKPLPEPLSWMLRDVLPFWAETAQEKLGGFAPDLTLGGRIAPSRLRPSRVQTRSLYVFSSAYILCREKWAFLAAQRAYEFIVSFLRHPDGGWIAAATPEGKVADKTRDLFDQAFILFALAWWHRASGDRRAVDLAEQTLDFIDAELAAGRGGGYVESDKREVPRRQNPHMHLLEAFQAWFVETGDEKWLCHARQMTHLFLAKFLDRETGTLREYLGDDLSPFPGRQGLIREPGHHMEWTWLLLQQSRLAAEPDLFAVQEALFATARRYGLDSHGLVVDAIAPDGRVLQPTLSLWPQTEAVKAYAARSAFLGEDLGRAGAMLASLRKYFFAERGPLWINRLSPDLRPMVDLVPTRLLYHLMMAVTYYAGVSAGPPPAAQDSVSSK